jgi:hypothetical protein
VDFDRSILVACYNWVHCLIQARWSNLLTLWELELANLLQVFAKVEFNHRSSSPVECINWLPFGITKNDVSNLVVLCKFELHDAWILSRGKWKQSIVDLDRLMFLADCANDVILVHQVEVIKSVILTQDKYWHLPHLSGLRVKLVDRQSSFHILTYNFVTITIELDLLDACFLWICLRRRHQRDELVERFVFLLPEFPTAENTSLVPWVVDRKMWMTFDSKGVV